MACGRSMVVVVVVVLGVFCLNLTVASDPMSCAKLRAPFASHMQLRARHKLELVLKCVLSKIGPGSPSVSSESKWANY